MVVALIFLITRGAVGFVNAFFRNIERGWVRVPWLDAETARATRRIVVVLLWIFAITAAYPHIPGSHTEAFRASACSSVWWCRSARPDSSTR